MPGLDKIHSWGTWSIFLWLLSDPGTHQRYADFLREHGFEDFFRIPLYTMRHEIGEALVQWFHADTGTFHLSCGEYIILPLDWTAILGIKFGRYPISTNDMSFELAYELLGIPLPLTSNTRAYFGPTASPQILIEWLQGSIPWGVAPINIHLRQFFMCFLGSCIFGNN